MTELMIPPWGVDTFTRPSAIGRVFYVHCWDGADTNNGISPNTPFQTIGAALTLVGDKRNDYIICLETWQQEASWPIELGAAHDYVHILGYTNPASLPVAYMSPDDDNCTFNLSGVTTVEIAGFNLGGGNSHGCIELGSSQRCWIHHCWFGNADQIGDTPLHGIFGPTGNTGYLCVEDCVFLGDNNTVGGGLTANGFHQIGGGAWMTIRRNRFMGCTIGYYSLNGGISMIYDNLFVCPDVQGAAITLGANALSTGNMVTGNVAMEGAETAMAANPFLDNNVGDINHWANNKCTLVAGAAIVTNLPA